MRSLTRRLLPLLALVGVFACSGDTRPTAPTARGPGAALLDGSNGGDERFFFLPPLAPDPSTNPAYDAGQFSAAWLPTVTACRLVSGVCDAASTHVFPPSTITVSLVNEQYQVSWDTNLPSFGLGVYRIAVSLPLEPARTLGYADVRLNEGGQSEGRVGDVVTLNDGRVIPIKFRIEKGLTVTGGSTDYLEVLVPDAGGVYKLPSGEGGFYFSNGWLGDPGKQVTLVMERLNVGTGPCVNAPDLSAVLQGFQQFEMCLRAHTYPDEGIIEADVVVAGCSELVSTANDSRFEAQSIFKYDAPNRLLELENVPPVDAAGVPWLTTADCAGFTGSTAPSSFGMLRDGARALAAGLGHLFGPNTAWALDVGLGGRLVARTDDFSDFFWGIPYRVDRVSGNGQSAAVGTLLPSPARVRVTGTHVHHHDGEEANVPGTVGLANVPVTFTVTAGGGTIGLATASQLVVNSDATGYAQVPWVVGLDAGTNTLTATLQDDPGRFNRQKSVAFTATGTATVPRSGDEVRVMGPSSPGPGSNDVFMPAGVARPFNAKAYKSGTRTTQVCTWLASKPAQVQIVVPGTDPGAVSITLAAGTRNSKVDITCGTGSTALRRSLFFTAR